MQGSTKKEEIEAKLGRMSDFLKMEYLESCLKLTFDTDIQKYCYKKLVELYEDKKMFSEAIKYQARLESVCNTSNEKIPAIIKGAELMIIFGNYDGADSLYKKALSLGNDMQRFEIKRNRIKFYKQMAETLERSNKSTGAAKIYELLINSVADAEKKEIKEKALEIYRRLGRVKEYLKLKTELEG